MTEANKRAAFDWYQDPPEAIEALLAVERFAGSSWDPCCGIGTIPKAMIAAGYRCFGTDVTYRGPAHEIPLIRPGKFDQKEAAFPSPAPALSSGVHSVGRDQ